MSDRPNPHPDDNLSGGFVDDGPCRSCGGPVERPGDTVCDTCFDDQMAGDYDDAGGCCECGGSGWIVTCVDDLCHGQSWCFHGDGNQPCPSCGNPSGEPSPNARRR